MTEVKNQEVLRNKFVPSVALLKLDNMPINIEHKFECLRPEHFSYLAEGMVNLINLVVDRDIHTLFFIDNSARPAGTFFLETWENLFPDTDSPAVRFVNINRDDPVDEKRIRELAARFYIPRGSNICVADEYVDNGQTILKAKEVFSAAFPEAKVTYTGIFSRLPSWFRWSDALGVVDPKASDPAFLSQPHRYKYNQLRKSLSVLRYELSLLARAIAEHIEKKQPVEFDVSPYIPSTASRKAQKINERK